MIKKPILGLILLLVAGLGQAQVVDGYWLGKLTQQSQPPFDQYRIQLTLQQDGNTVTGTSRIHLWDSLHLFAEMEIQGRIVGDKLYFQETKVLDSYQFGTMDWCLKTGTLKTNNLGGILQMRGDWSGKTGATTCAPGNIVVEKVIRRQPKEKIVSKKHLLPPPKNAPLPEINFGSLDGRKITRQKNVPVRIRLITAYIYDSNKEDGDIISLRYNGKWVLKDYSLKNNKKSIELRIEPGKENKLILYAENLGRIPPNTCALSFFDGEKNRTLSLVSDKRTCGALQFEFKK